MKLILVDGMALLYRAHFAMIRSPLRDSQGRNTSAIFGFARVLLALLEKEKPTHWAVAFDTQAPTFRHDAFEEYKAHRPPMPEDLVPQIDEVKKLLDAMRVRVILRDGFEADDLMAALARRAGGEGCDVRLFSSDKDLLQVVDERVHALIPQGKGEEALELGPAQVREHWGVGPEHIIDVLALMGDSVDNVPGVKGVGEKTAVMLMSRYGSLEALYEDLEQVMPQGLREKLRAGRESAFFSRHLVTLDLDCAAEFQLSDLPVRKFDAPRLAELFRGWQFRRLEARFSGLEPHAGDEGRFDPPAAGAAREPAPAPAPPQRPGPETPAADAPVPPVPSPALGGPAPELRRAERPAEAIALLGDLSRSDRVAIECIPAHTGRPGEQPQWMVLQGDGIAGALRWAGLSADEGFQSAMKSFLIEGPRLTCGDSRALARYLRASSLPAPRAEHDLEIATHLLEMASRQREAVLGESMPELPRPGENLALDFGDHEPPLEGTAAMLRHRMAESARLASALEDRGEWDLYQELEIPLAPVIADMEETGVRVDTGILSELSRRFTGDLHGLEQEIFRLAGTEFNVLSTKQLAHVLFEKHGLPSGKKTKTGFSTDSEVLEELALTYELPGKVLEYRQLAKLLSTYVDALPAMVDGRTMRIHARFHQAVVPTGRLSSSDPNLQNIPIRTPQGKEIRRAFTTDPGWRLISADYSQIELRVMAHFSKEPAFLSAFAEGQDIHTRTASEVFGIPISEVTSEQRGRAKTINFGLMYGMGAQNLGRQLRISMKEAAVFIESYFARLPRVKLFREQLLEEARRDGYVTTLLGRRISLPGIRSGDRRLAAGSERAALNAPLQGSAADLIKKAMLLLHAELARRALPARIIIQVHDELVLETDSACEAEVEALARTCMEGAARLDVPLTASVGSGDNWFEIH